MIDVIKELRQIGYWCGPGHESLPDPQWFVDESWDPTVRDRIGKYLDRGYCAFRARGKSWCRFYCRALEFDMGSGDFTDGVYLWPQGLSHYVYHHAVRLPDEFVAHAMERDLPDGIDEDGHRRRRPLTDQLPSRDWWRAQVGWGPSNPQRREFGAVDCYVPTGKLGEDALAFLQANAATLYPASREHIRDLLNRLCEPGGDERTLCLGFMDRDAFERRKSDAVAVGLRLAWQPCQPDNAAFSRR